MKLNQIATRLRQRGQGMTEYIIIVALIAIAAIAVYQLFGNTVRNQTAAMAMELSGKSGKEANDKAGTEAEAAAQDAADKKTLKNFTGNADK